METANLFGLTYEISHVAEAEGDEEAVERFLGRLGPSAASGLDHPDLDPVVLLLLVRLLRGFVGGLGIAPEAGGWTSPASVSTAEAAGRPRETASVASATSPWLLASCLASSASTLSLTLTSPTALAAREREVN